MSEGIHEMIHETALFYGVTYGTHIVTIKPSDYAACSDFGAIYTALSDHTVKLHDDVQRMIDEDITRKTFARRKHSSSSETNTVIPVYQPPPNELINYSIAKDLLYYQAGDGVLRLCKYMKIVCRPKFFKYWNQSNLTGA